MEDKEILEEIEEIPVGSDSSSSNESVVGSSQADSKYDPLTDKIKTDTPDDPNATAEEEEQEEHGTTLTETRTVKLGARKLFRNHELRHTVIETVDKMNHIMFHGSRILNMYVLQQLESGGDLELLTNTFGGTLRHPFALATTAASGQRTTEPSSNMQTAAETYKQLVAKHDIKLPLNSGITNLLNNQVNLYRANLENHVTTNVKNRVLRWLRHI